MQGRVETHILLLEADADLELATERLDVLPERAEAHIVLVLDLAHAGLTDAHELRELRLGNVAVLPECLEEFVLRDQRLRVRVDTLAALGGQVLDEAAKRLSHLGPPDLRGDERRSLRLAESPCDTSACRQTCCHRGGATPLARGRTRRGCGTADLGAARVTPSSSGEKSREGCRRRDGRGRVPRSREDRHARL